MLLEIELFKTKKKEEEEEEKEKKNQNWIKSPVGYPNSYFYDKISNILL